LSLSPHESQQSVRRLTAGVLALSGFMVAILSGLNAGNPTGSVIITAIVCMVVCHIAGSILGVVLENVLTEHRRALSAQKTPSTPAQAGIEVDQSIELEQPIEEDQGDPARVAA
jgi:hypothetical protein